MRRFALLLVLALAASARAGDVPAALTAGFATVDLTPSKPVPLAGYEERKGTLSTGVLDPVKARAAVFADADTKVAIVSADLFAVSARLHDAVVARTKDLGLAAVLLAATNTHSGPGGLLDAPFRRAASGPFDAALLEETAERIAKAVRLADADRKPARLAYGQRDEADRQRREHRTGNGEPGSLGVLRIEGDDGKSRGILIHLQAAATALGPENSLLTADWPGGLCDASEKATGATTLFLNGATVDIPPALPTSGAAGARAFGGGLAEDALAVQTKADEPSVSVDAVPTPLSTCAAPLLGRRTEHCLVPEPIAHPGLRVRLGSLTLATVAGEPTASVAARIARDSRTWVVGGAQDDLGVFADADAVSHAASPPSYAADGALFGPDASDELVRALRGEGPEPPPRVDAGAATDPTAPVDVTSAKGEAPGLRHGVLLRARIRSLLAAAEDRWKKEILQQGGGLLLANEVLATRVPAADLLGFAMARVARAFLRRIPTDLIEEMEGVARGAGVPFDAILLENVFATLAEQVDKTALLKMPPRCTNVVATGPATSMGQLIHASTLDWGMVDVLKDRTVVLVQAPESGFPFVSVTWPGMVGTLRAMGAQGIAITEESCQAKDDTTTDGLPLNLLMREVVQHARDLDGAVRRVRGAPGTCGYKVTISDGHALDARVVEVTAHHSQVRAPKDGLLFGCDPEAPCLDGDCDPAIPRNDPESAVRYPAIRALLESGAGGLRTPLVSTALATTAGGVLNEHTLLAVVFEPQLLRFHVALGDDVDPVEGTLAWKSWSLPDLLPPEIGKRYRDPRPVRWTGPVDATKRTVPLLGVEVWDVEFDSPRPSGHAFNDLVRGELFLPENARGVVILLPPWKEKTLAGDRIVATALAAKGIAAFVLPLPYQASRTPPGERSGAWTLSSDLARTREALLQGAEDAAFVSLWLEKARGFPPERQGIMGISLGGHVAALACGAYPDRFGCGAFLLAGSHIDRPFLEKNGTTDQVRDALIARGVTADEAVPFLSVLDPGNYGLPDRRDRVLLVGCREDPVVPPSSVEALAKAWGGAKVVWFPGNHYGLLLHMGEVLQLVTDHFRDRFGPP